MQKHVFVTAVSVFGNKDKNEQTVMRTTTYRFEDQSIQGDERFFSHTGHYQLEPIPAFINEKIGTITDIVLLETAATRETDARMHVFPGPDGSPEWPASGEEPGTVVQWYEKWLRLNIPNAKIHHLPIDEHNPGQALEDTISKIRELYSFTKSDEEWRLWIDTHGGFRVLSEVLATASRLFTLGKDPIPTDGIFTVYHSQTGNVDEIVNLTPFYFTNSAKSLQDYLNYGQYLNMQFQPCDCKDPYAFVSYRHDKAFLTSVRTVFGKLQENQLEFWFDDGIRTGENWEQTLRTRNNDAAVFLGLLTNSYFESPECWKELILAIADAKKTKKQFFFIILDTKLTLPNAIPNEPKYKKVLALKRRMKVTNADIRGVLDPKIQQIQGYKYMFGNEQTQINMRNANDCQLAEDLQMIRNAMNKTAAKA